MKSNPLLCYTLHALEIYNTFTWTTEGDNKKIEKILEKFEEYCTPRKNITLERHIFNTRVQRTGETIDQYVTDLRKKANSCEFGMLHDSLIRDRIVCGISDDHTRSRLSREADLTLAKAVDICSADEITTSQLKALTASGNQPTQKELGLQLLRNKSKPVRQKQQCGWCGEEHSQGQCPGFGKYCDKCGKRTKKHQNIQTICNDSSDNKDDWWTQSAIINQKGLASNTNINRRVLSFKIDTGAQCNVISKTAYNFISKSSLTK